MEDEARLKITITGTLKKYEGDWTEEQMLNGEADEALVEVVTLEDGVVVDRWVKDEEPP